MNVFKELRIELGENEPEYLISKIQQKLKRGWVRDKEHEQESGINIGVPVFCFRSPDTANASAARVYLCRKDDVVFYVPNVVPVRFSRLSKDEYNCILEEFYRLFVAPVCAELGIVAEISSNEQNIEELISSDTAEKLRSFSSLANRIIPHSLDVIRWYQFLLSVHNNEDRPNPEVLKRWLIEDEHWPEDGASELASQYDFAMGLLDYQNGLEE